VIGWRENVPASFFGAPSRLLLTPFQRGRLVYVLAREPDLEAWQIAERFGLTEQQAITLLGHRKRVRS